jgi:hypothetical protein
VARYHLCTVGIRDSDGPSGNTFVRDWKRGRAKMRCAAGISNDDWRSGRGANIWWGITRARLYVGA